MNRKGQILIEAIAATVIIAISLTVIMQSLVSSYRNTSLQKEYTQGLILLQNNLSKLLFGSQITQDDTSDLSPQMFDQKQAVSDQDGNLKSALLSVTWPSGKKMRQLSTVTFIYENSETSQQ